jgi:hypothetical protein
MSFLCVGASGQGSVVAACTEKGALRSSDRRAPDVRVRVLVQRQGGARVLDCGTGRAASRVASEQARALAGPPGTPGDLLNT